MGKAAEAGWSITIYLPNLLLAPLPPLPRKTSGKGGLCFFFRFLISVFIYISFVSLLFGFFGDFSFLTLETSWQMPSWAVAPTSGQLDDAL